MYNVAASLYVAAVLLLLSLVAVQVFMAPCGYITGSGCAGVAAPWMCIITSGGCASVVAPYMCCGTMYVCQCCVCVPVPCMCAGAMC